VRYESHTLGVSSGMKFTDRLTINGIIDSIRGRTVQVHGKKKEGHVSCNNVQDFNFSPTGAK
jgi:hypothetical protein